MNAIGRWAFNILLPLVRLFIRRTKRAYIIIESDGQVLLTKSWFGHQAWQLPGGGVHHGEANLQAATRELREETGVVVGSSACHSVVTSRWQSDNLGFSYEVFYCQARGPLPLKVRRPELIDCRFVKPDELSADNCGQDVLQALTTAGLI